MMKLVSNLFIVTCCFSQCSGQTNPTEDLTKLLKEHGFEAQASTYPYCIEKFLIFDTSQQAAMVARGNISLAEAKSAAEAHRISIKSKKLRITNIKQYLSAKHIRSPEGDSLKIILRLPLKVTTKKSLYKDKAGLEGAFNEIHRDDTESTFLAYLSKDRTLIKCNGFEALSIEKSGGYVYVRESVDSSITVYLKLDNSIINLKNKDNYVFEIEIYQLSLERPFSWGYYRRDRLKEATQDTDMLRDQVAVGIEDPDFPTYFPVSLDGHANGAVPEICTARLISLILRDKNGSVIASYRPSD